MMTATPSISSGPGSRGVSGTSTASEGPDWQRVPFDVFCARCGHDLRGLREPKCPACGLTFDWADAVPIEALTCGTCGYHLFGLTEARCPECGTAFTWDEALERHHRKRNPLFEYQWASRPIRSFLRTWRRTLRPQRFWTSVDIHDPPRVGALLLYMIAGACGLAAMLVLLQAIHDWLWGWATTGQPWAVFFRLAPLPPSWAAAGLTVEPWRRLASSLVGAVSTPAVLWPLPVVAGWLGVSFLSLLILRQSMRRYRVRTAQVFRVCMYALPAFVPIVWLTSYVESYIFLVRRAWSDGRAPTGCAVLLALGMAVRSIRCGYRDYLKMPHSLGVALATQAIALGIVAAVMLLAVIVDWSILLSVLRDWGLF